MIKFLDLYSQYSEIKNEIDEAIRLTIEKSQYIGGPSVEKFEIEFAQYLQVKHCIGVANGTDALEIAIEALDLPPGSEIIVPANSFIASSEAVTRCGHQVVFADVDQITYTLDIEDVIKKINPNTRALIAVHLYGHPCNMNSLSEVAKNFSLKIIEDCAQAHGAEYLGSKVGGFGDIAAFSFYPGKNLGAYGDAGAITSNSDDLITKCRMIANHGRLEKYVHLIEGRNSRLDGLQAAILSVKLKHLNRWVEMRNIIASEYLRGFADIHQIILPSVALGSQHAFHLFVIRATDRDGLANFLLDKQIQTGVHYPLSLARQPAYAHLEAITNTPIADSMASTILSLPVGDHLQPQEVCQVIDSVRLYFAGHSSC
jgi:dTDP-4-amino-4,6-dideoxygalactose transaminase